MVAHKFSVDYFLESHVFFLFYFFSSIVHLLYLTSPCITLSPVTRGQPLSFQEERLKFLNQNS